MHTVVWFHAFLSNINHHHHHRVVLTAQRSLTLSCYPSLSVGLLACILCPHRIDIKKISLLISQHLYIHVLESIREHCLWVYPCSSISTLCVLFILLEWFVRWEPSGHTVAVLWAVVSRQHAAFLCSSHQAFSQCVLFASVSCIHIIVWTQQQSWKNPVLFYRIDQNFKWLNTYQ